MIACYSKLVFRGHCISAVYLSHTSLPCWTTSWDGIKPLYIRDLVYGFPITEKWTYMIVFVLNCQIRTISNVMMHKLLQIITPKAFLRYISLYYKYFKIHGWRFTWWNIMKANVRWINWLSCLRVAIRCNIWENALFVVVNHPRCDVVTWQINVLRRPFMNESMYLIKQITGYNESDEWRRSVKHITL